MVLSKLDLLNKTFPSRLFGYAKAEVNQFMTEVAEDLGAAAEDKKALQDRIDQLEHQLSEFRQREQTLRDTLMTTQKMVDDLKATAHREAQIILDRAKLEAEGVVRGASERAARLEEEMNELKRQRIRFETQFRGILETHARLLDAESAEESPERNPKFLKKAK